MIFSFEGDIRVRENTWTIYHDVKSGNRLWGPDSVVVEVEVNPHVLEN